MARLCRLFAICDIERQTRSTRCTPRSCHAPSAYDMQQDGLQIRPSEDRGNRTALRSSRSSEPASSARDCSPTKLTRTRAVSTGDDGRVKCEPVGLCDLARLTGTTAKRLVATLGQRAADRTREVGSSAGTRSCPLVAGQQSTEAHSRLEQMWLSKLQSN